MIAGKLRYLLYMAPILWALIKDLVWEDLSLEEIRTHYLFGKADAYERANLFEKSVKVYQEILKTEPNRVTVLLNLGGLYYRKGMFHKAIPYYEKVIRANSKHYQGHYWLARCYWRLERYYAAINTLEEVIETLPTFKDALNLMGECYERIGEAAKAEHYYIRAISADPNGFVILGAMASKETSEKKREERVKH